MMLTYALLLIVPFVVLAGGYMMFGKRANDKNVFYFHYQKIGKKTKVN